MKKLLLLSMLSLSANAYQTAATNDKLTINFNFDSNKHIASEPYIAGANKWLNEILSVDGKKSHTIYIDVIVQESKGGNGAATIYETETVNGLEIPNSGAIMIGKHTYAEGFDQTEFHANIVHEIGHVLGIGITTDRFLKHSDEVKGMAFCMENSKAVQSYNQIYSRNYSCLPFSESGHLYDYVVADDQERKSDNNGQEVPPMTLEVMANGNDIGIIGLKLLDDLGYRIKE